jgi:ribosome recycling factor
MAYTVDTLLDTLEENMMKTEDSLTTAFSAIRTGKASPALVENITFEYYGTQTRIRDAAGITAPEPRLLVIQPWDASAVKSIEKALLSSNIGITPMSDGRSLKLPIPELSQERRAALSKQAKASAEDAKVALRNIRRDANDAVKKFEKDGELTEDDVKREKKAIQKLTDDYTKKVDELLKSKSAEVMEI